MLSNTLGLHIRYKISMVMLAVMIFAAREAKASSFVTNLYCAENGLSHNTVWCGLQDSYGFIWLGTSNGLNCFDGRQNTVFRASSHDGEQALGSNFVHALFEDKQKRIWVGTNCGIYIYTRGKGFAPFTLTTKFGVSVSSEVKKIIPFADDLLVIATLGQGLFFYNTKEETLEQNNRYSSFFWDICTGGAANSRLYAASLQEGVLCFDQHRQLTETYLLKNPSATDQLSLKANTLLPANEKIWVGTDSRYLFEIIPGEKDAKPHELKNKRFQIVQSLSHSADNRFFLGTDNGVYLYTPQDDTPAELKEIYKTKRLTESQHINAFIKDTEGGIWALTNQSGAIYITAQDEIFSHHEIPGNLTVNSFCEDSERNLIWVGTQNGLFGYEPESGKIERYRFAESDTYIRDIRTLCLDGDKLWIGTFANGVKVLNLTDGRVKSYQYANTPNTICSNNVQKIYRCKDGRIYIGTNWGLCYYNPEEDNFRSEGTVGAMIPITDIYEDGGNNLWVTTDYNGVFMNNREKAYWKHYEHKPEDERSLCNNSVITLFEDADKNLWLGTNGSGLCRFDAATETFTTLNSNSKMLSSLVVSSIEQDPAGDLWITSNMGLLRVSLNKQGEYQYFTTADGLQSNLFYEKASLRTAQGVLMFGGMGGFNSLNPALVRKNTFAPPVYITDFTLTHVSDSVDTREILGMEQPVFLTRRLEIPFKYNSFTVSFSALSYQAPAKNRFTYKLEGLDTEWNNSTKENTASYNNLPPGKYSLLVKGSNNDLIWSNNIARLEIIITPPWYRTVWAYIAYLLAAVCTVAFILYKRDKHLKLKYQKKVEEYQVEKDRELYKNKVNFFIYLIHEIRTPLTLIKMPLDSILHTETDSETEKRYLNVINKNVNYLLGITNELLDFQKIEAGTIKLHLKPKDIRSLINNTYQQFTGCTDLKHIGLSVKMDDNFSLEALIDEEIVNRILVNLLSNAMKYARQRIELIVRSDDNELFISVDDDGPGIKDEEKENIFRTYYQVDNEKAAQGSGIGLAYARILAESHHGTLTVTDSSMGGASFILTLPVYKENTQEDLGIITDAEPINPDTAENPAQHAHTVLLVEDNAELLEIEATELSRYYRVLKARNGIEAMQVIESREVDVVITDVMMPLMNGLELCSKVKENMAYSHIPVILLTAKTMPEAKAEGLSCGADAYVEKPFTVRQIHLQVRNLLKLRKALQQQITESDNTPENNQTAESNPLITAKDREFIEEMQTIIERQLDDENFSIDSLAAEVNMSRSNFYRKLKALTGMAPNDYLKNCRLNKAARLLKEGYRINEAFEQTGFGSSSYFAKCFKAKYGVLPKDYLESLNTPNGKE